MREQLERRQTELAAELKAGQEMLAELDVKRLELQQTMLRISGALQVLTELLEGDEPTDRTSDEQGKPALASA